MRWSGTNRVSFTEIQRVGALALSLALVVSVAGTVRADATHAAACTASQLLSSVASRGSGLGFPQAYQTANDSPTHQAALVQIPSGWIMAPNSVSLRWMLDRQSCSPELVAVAAAFDIFNGSTAQGSVTFVEDPTASTVVEYTISQVGVAPVSHSTQGLWTGYVFVNGGGTNMFWNVLSVNPTSSHCDPGWPLSSQGYCWLSI